MGKFEEAKKRMFESYRHVVTVQDSSSDDEELELNDEQLSRLDEMYDAAHKLCSVIAEEPNLEFDMYYAGTIVEFAVDLLLERGKPIRYPGIVTDEDGSRIEEYCYTDDMLERPIKNN